MSAFVILSKTLNYIRSMFKNHSIIYLFLFFIGNIFSQTTAIPDPIFEQYLIDSGIDSDGLLNGIVTTEDISGIVFFSVANEGITDLTGIQDFSNLQELNCNNNALTSLDLSQNLTLTKVYCSENQITNLNLGQNIVFNEVICSENELTTLDVSQNTSLKRLFCDKNQISNLDVRQNTQLTHLSVTFNSISNLDVSQNIALSVLNCGYNPIKDLDVTNNKSLIDLACANSDITNLDISQNSNLLDLSVGGNELTNLDLSQNLSLETFSCDNNQISSLNLSQHTSLKFVDCSFNNLTILNVKNGNNNILNFVKATNNSQLQCIDVDNEIDANALTGDYSIWQKDANTMYSENCSSVLGTGDRLLATSIQVYPNPVKHKLNIDSKINLKYVEFYTLFGQKAMSIQSGFNSISIDNLSSGVYFLHIFSQNGTTIRKLMKE